MQTMPTRKIALFLGLLASATWGIVAGEAYLMGEVDLTSLGTAVAFTATLIALPFVAGVRLSGKPARPPCRQCGAFAMAGIPFCIHCGAFPKPAPAALAE